MADIKQSEHKLRPLKDLKLWDKNPRRGTKIQMDKLRKKIERNDLYKALITTPDGTIIGGNMRYRILTDMGVKEVWCSIIEPRDEAHMIEIAISDNENDGEWVEEQLAELVHDQPIELDLYSVHLSQPISLAKMLEQETDLEEDEAPEPDEGGGAVSVPGEIYKLGTHRLMCGDSTDFGQVSDLMDGVEADMVFTDPPYGVDYEGKTKDKLTIQNDGDTEIFARAIDNFITKPGAAYYVCCPAGNNFMDFVNAFETKCRMSCTIVWAKNSMVLGHGDYHYQHEPILYGWDKEGTHKFYGSRDQTTIWHIDRPSRSKDHPTMKPLALVGKAIKNSSQPGDVILDLFGGSGSTLIAAEQMKRVCYMMELDPIYCDVIRKRYANTIGAEDWEEATPSVA